MTQQRGGMSRDKGWANTLYPRIGLAVAKSPYGP